MSTEAPSDELPTWTDQIRSLEGIGERLVAKRGLVDGSAADIQDMNSLAMGILASGYLNRVYNDPARPVFTPLWSHAFNQAGPNPDFVYRTAPVDHRGVYRISGFRGTCRFVDVAEHSWTRLLGMRSRFTSPATHDLDDLDLAPDGSFSVLLSAERPAGYTGDWWRLDPITERLVVRACAGDWRNETDPRLAIERLDTVPPADAALLAERLGALGEWTEGMVDFSMELARYYRGAHGINTLLRSKIIAKVGGLHDQVYYDGIHELEPDEALVVDVTLPTDYRYWQILVADDRFATVDWVNRQSSLNDTQARIDADGHFRAVVSATDPGVPNWLDKGDVGWGMIQMRWNRASDAPDPAVVKVPVSRVRDHLPADTPVVTPQERAEALRARRESAQLRTLW